MMCLTYRKVRNLVNGECLKIKIHLKMSYLHPVLHFIAISGGLPKSVSRVTLDEAVSKLKDIIGTRPIVVAYKEGAQVSRLMHTQLVVCFSL